MGRRRRVLFFAEAVTLAHVARPMALAQYFDHTAIECSIACDARYGQFLQEAPWVHVPLHSIESARFLRSLAQGSPVYDLATLREYVREDLALIEQLAPDVVVGDFRLSLSVSARLAKVPYVAIANAYWSPYYTRAFPMPVLPMTRLLPLAISQLLFGIASPLAMPRHCASLNRLRAENGLPSLGTDLRHSYTDADLTLYADDPVLFALRDAPANHVLIGPVLWEPRIPLPTWWGSLPDDRPMVYVTLGSSGPTDVLAEVLRALSELPVTVVASSAGQPAEQRRQGNAFMAPFLPGNRAAARSSLVICNGGSLTAYQALAAGVPVLGMASNMDQFMNMGAIVERGAGLMLRTDRLTKTRIRNTVGKMVGAAEFHAAAKILADAIAVSKGSTTFCEQINKMTRGDPV